MRHGIQGLRFGNVITSLVREGERLEVESNMEYTLMLNGKEIRVAEGKQVVVLK